jgi:LPXTG-motif cell wall-anchored protein
MKRIVLILISVAALSLGVFQVAFAHAKIDHCTPAVDSTVAQAPAQVVCVMSEEIDTQLSTMSVWDAAGVQVDKRDAHVDLNDPDHKTLLVSLDTSSITNGVLTVKYHTVTPDDNGITDGTFQFVVGSAATTPVPDVTATSAMPESGEATPTPAAMAMPAESTATPAESMAAPAESMATPAESAAAMATPTESAAATPVATPAALPSTGESQSNAVWVIGLLGVILAGGGLVVRRLTR